MGGFGIDWLTGTLNGYFFKFVKNGTGKAPARLAKFGVIVSLLCKTSRLHVAVSLFSGKSQNVVGTTVAHSVIASCATFLSRISKMIGSEFSIHRVGLFFLGVRVSHTPSGSEIWVSRSDFSLYPFGF